VNERENTEMKHLIEKLSDDVHMVKGSLAANTSFTREVLDQLESLHERQSKSEEKLTTIMASNAEMSALFNAGKKGVNFFQAIGRFLNRAARWAAPILMVIGAIWAILHGQPPRGHE
jgi:hypothetical protein